MAANASSSELSAATPAQANTTSPHESEEQELGMSTLKAPDYVQSTNKAGMVTKQNPAIDIAQGR